MSSRIDAPSGTAAGQGRSPSERLLRRSAVWACFLQNLYGHPRGPDVGLESNELPLLDGLGAISRSQLVARPRLLRDLLAPLVVGPEPPPSTPEFRELVLASVRDEGPRSRTFAEAIERLRTWGRERFAIEPAAAARARRLALRLFDPEDLLRVQPSMITSLAGVFTLSRRALVKAPLESIRGVVDPRNWTTMGEFFDFVSPVGHVAERDDGWSGLFEERFEIGWGPWRINSCNPFLRVDFTFDRARVRADYALAYEADDQLECDDGYLEVTRLPGNVGWCEYYAEKSTKFRAPSTNLLAPAVMAVFLESNLSSLEDAVHAHHASVGEERS